MSRIGEQVFVGLEQARGSAVWVEGTLIAIGLDNRGDPYHVLAVSESCPAGVPGELQGVKYLAVRKVTGGTPSSARIEHRYKAGEHDSAELGALLEAWTRLQMVVPLSASDTEPPRPPPGIGPDGGLAPVGKKAQQQGLGALFQNMEASGLFGGANSRSSGSAEEESDSSSNSSDAIKSYLSPGGGNGKRGQEKRRKKKKKDHKSRRHGGEENHGGMGSLEDLANTMRNLKVMGVEVDGNALIALALMQQGKQSAKLDKPKKKKGGRRSRSTSDGSDSEEEDKHASRGHKEVAAYHKWAKRMRKDPKRVWRDFEKRAAEEVGVIEGEAWTLQRWIKEVINWKGAAHQKRAAYIMVMVYEALRRKEVDLALALLSQGVKALRQSATAGGQWRTAWRFMGCQDPFTTSSFAGNEEELAVIGGMERGMSELEKRWTETKPKEEDKT